MGAMLLTLFVTVQSFAASTARPNIIFVMADDMGWGETSYRNHPVLKTPHLDDMATAGLRLDRFYAGCPVCSPTRATVLTGRSNDRTGVLSHGYALRRQEKTIAQALKKAGYVTGHFGKWHLNGLRGPGVPILANDAHSPGVFGFDEWVSITNFFDLNPILSRQGTFEEFEGDSSEIVVSEGLKFTDRHRNNENPFFAVLWFGTPHSPFRALPEDRKPFDHLDSASANHYGELVALDRSIGTLRQRLREYGIAEQTLLVFCSDNGGLPKVTPETVGHLRGFKGSVYEGGLRVPAIIEWPGVIVPRVTKHPACTMDLFPTIADLLQLPPDALTQPVDGTSLLPLFKNDLSTREMPIAFRFREQAALVDNRYKIVCPNLSKQRFEVYDLESDPAEAHDLSTQRPELTARLKQALLAWNESVDRSFAGQDYPEGTLTSPDPEPISWTSHPGYRPYLDQWRNRPEYEAAIRQMSKRK
jgi:arylsulfatase A-like enzyme